VDNAFDDQQQRRILVERFEQNRYPPPDLVMTETACAEVDS
jgi:hypothetical protein